MSFVKQTSTFLRWQLSHHLGSPKVSLLGLRETMDWEGQAPAWTRKMADVFVRGSIAHKVDHLFAN